MVLVRNYERVSSVCTHSWSEVIEFLYLQIPSTPFYMSLWGRQFKMRSDHILEESKVSVDQQPLTCNHDITGDNKLFAKLDHPILITSSIFLLFHLSLHDIHSKRCILRYPPQKVKMRSIWHIIQFAMSKTGS